MLEKYVPSLSFTSSSIPLSSSSLTYAPWHPSFSNDRFFKMLEDDPLRAWYSEPHVLKAAERGAIGKLLISDEIFRYVFLSSPNPSAPRLNRFVFCVGNVERQVRRDGKCL